MIKSQPSSQTNQNHVTEQRTREPDIEDDHMKELMSGIKKTMPEGIYQELKNKSGVKKATDTITIGNDQKKPTLRLDFTYQDDQLIQFVNKEYGFLETLPKNKSKRTTSQRNSKDICQSLLESRCQAYKNNRFKWL